MPAPVDVKVASPAGASFTLTAVGAVKVNLADGGAASFTLPAPPAPAAGCMHPAGAGHMCPARVGRMRPTP